MNNGEPEREPVAERSPNQWRTVAEVAELEGITPRAVQRRCQAGKYEARRVPGEKGEVWEIAASSVKATANTTTNNHEEKGEQVAEPSANKSEPIADASAWSKREAELREEISFLRGLVEGHQRSEAELRAALREALKAMPKELGTAPYTPPEGVQTAPPAQAPPTVPAPAIGPLDGPQRPSTPAPIKEPRPLWKVVLGIR